MSIFFYFCKCIKSVKQQKSDNSKEKILFNKQIIDYKQRGSIPKKVGPLFFFALKGLYIPAQGIALGNGLKDFKP
jgi:hypothetical protein